jgi:hypothetical protein
MNKLLLTVEEVFLIAGRHVVLSPDIPLERKPPQTHMQVSLRRPDGSIIVCQASFHIPHIHFSDIEATLEHLKREPTYVCMLKGVEKQEVHPGTEVWINSD